MHGGTAGSTGSARLSAEDRQTILVAFHAANAEARRRLTHVRRFRNMALVGAIALLIAASGLAILGFADPALVSLCFTADDQLICPTGVTPADGDGNPADIALVETIGLIAASVAAAATPQNVRGTGTPYGIPVALAIVKLPAGTLAAVLGLLLMQDPLKSDATTRDSVAQILSWAIVFGYAQQLFTQFVDERGHLALELDQPSALPPATTNGTRSPSATSQL
jgi:hypothetical protein